MSNIPSIPNMPSLPKGLPSIPKGADFMGPVDRDRCTFCRIFGKFFSEVFPISLVSQNVQVT